ncbi:hypothetical protein EJ04DRAFT_275409 [Polyplosphaeria fusca]|uniref:Uncharacterized protein n=1 Tax=Polyplosphaeria fusca TaxID=682080 RepID=A0A9P4QYH7_9PLEO|nr:hypothetical protein EJ04DRAFT_275409 [Polyplosphaeria fusca]
MKFNTLTLTTLLASTATAATVTLRETPCLQATELEEFTIETDKLVVKGTLPPPSSSPSSPPSPLTLPTELKSVCGLSILSASGISPSSLVCQAYKDAAGTQLGSARFTQAEPALISTNPVQEGSIRCDSNSTTIGQGNGTTVTSVTLVTLPLSTGTAVSSAVSSGSAVPTGANSTTAVSATGTPTQPAAPTGATDTPGAAARVGGASFVVVAAGLAAMLL